MLNSSNKQENIDNLKQDDSVHIKISTKDYNVKVSKSKSPGFLGQAF